MIAAGILLGPHGLDYVDGVVLRESSDLRLLALVVILLRAGLGLPRAMLNEVGGPAIRLGLIPSLCEATLVAAASAVGLGLGWRTGAWLGLILAAVSPAVVVPAMLSFREKGLGMKRQVPVLILAASAVDNLCAVTAIAALARLAQGSIQGHAGGSALWNAGLRVLVELLGGAAVGGLLGWITLRAVPLTGGHGRLLDEFLLLLLGGIAAILVGRQLPVAGLLAVVVVGLVVLEGAPAAAARAAHHLSRAWIVAELILFVLVGTLLNPTLAITSGWASLALIALGLLGRVTGVYLSTWGARLSLADRHFCAAASIPKATVQAALGSLPLTLGLPNGEMILAVAVLSILVTTPLGAVLIRRLGPVWLRPFPRGAPIAQSR